MKEIRVEKPLEQQNTRIQILKAVKRIVKSALANPNLTPGQREALFESAALTIFACNAGNLEWTGVFAKKLLEISNPLIVPAETAEEQK